MYYDHFKVLHPEQLRKAGHSQLVHSVTEKGLRAEQSYGNSVHGVIAGKICKVHCPHTVADVDGSPCVEGDSIMFGMVVQIQEIC